MEPRKNFEIKTNESGNQAVVFTTESDYVVAACYVDWKNDGVFIRSRTFKTRSGADRFAARFFGGLR